MRPAPAVCYCGDPLTVAFTLRLAVAEGMVAFWPRSGLSTVTRSALTASGTLERPVMNPFPLPALASVLIVSLRAIALDAPPTRVLAEDFSANPLNHGWELHGSPTLFHWNSATESLDVTWDSTKPNSYLQLPLGTLLTRHDDFSLDLDLSLKDIRAGLTDEKPGTFQIAFGFQNRASAIQEDFIRGTGDRSPHLVEFNFFPDTGYGPTIWPAIFPESGRMNYTGSSDFSLFELPIDVTMRISLHYTAKNETASIRISTNGVLVGPVAAAPLSRTFTSFELDTLAVSSYSDEGQPPFMPGSILAHGTLDNLIIKTPYPPIRFESGTWLNGRWQQTFISQVGWIYELEGTTDLRVWTKASARSPGDGGSLTLAEEATHSTPHRFFRVKAERSK